MAIDPVVPSVENTIPVTKTPALSVGNNAAASRTLDDRVLGDGITVNDVNTRVVNVSAAGANIDAASSSTPNKPTIKQRTNKLHEYVNWTYNIGWYMLDLSAFNDFVTTGKDSSALRTHPIFRSGGIKEASGTSGINFDLGLRSLRLGGVIGNNRFSPNANQYDIEMEIVEPYGVTLLPKLRILAASNGQGENREFQIPYLLDIRWVGYDDTGKIVTNIPDTGPKLIAVQITNVSFNITSSGTIYRITFGPYAQLPLSNTYGVIRTDTNLYGGTLDEVLISGENSLKAKLNAVGQNDKAEGRCAEPDTYDFVIESYSGDTRTSDGKLANAPMMYPVNGGSATLEYRKGTEVVDVDKQTWTYTASSNVKDIVSDLVRNSQYFYDLIVSPVAPGEVTTSNIVGSDLSLPQQDASAQLKAMQLIKVVPMIKKIGPYDNIRGVFQKDIVYKITPFYLYGQVNPRTGQAPVASRGFVKEYNWLFTGKNQDVYNIDLNYDLLYFRLFQTAAGQKGLAESSSESEVSTAPMVQGKPGGSAATYVSLAGDINARGSKGDKPNAVQEYFEQQLNPSYGNDLIQMDLDIIGDPDWIPQDRSIRPVGTSTDANNNGYVDGELAKGISVDVDGVYVNINFRTPVDYNDKTGLMNLTNESALISGFYQVITVDSVFEDGKFIQKLNLVRVPSQEKNVVKASAATTSNNTAIQTASLLLNGANTTVASSRIASDDA